MVLQRIGYQDNEASLLSIFVSVYMLGGCEAKIDCSVSLVSYALQFCFSLTLYTGGP